MIVSTLVMLLKLLVPPDPVLLIRATALVVLGVTVIVNVPEPDLMICVVPAIVPGDPLTKANSVGVDKSGVAVTVTEVVQVLVKSSAILLGSGYVIVLVKEKLVT